MPCSEGQGTKPYSCQRQSHVEEAKVPSPKSINPPSLSPPSVAPELADQVGDDTVHRTITGKTVALQCTDGRVAEVELMQNSEPQKEDSPVGFGTIPPHHSPTR
eukprot:5656411-Amphidinium_carterae.2